MEVLEHTCKYIKKNADLTGKEGDTTHKFATCGMLYIGSIFAIV